MKLFSVVLFAIMVAVVCAEHEKGKHGKGKGGPMGEFFKTCMEETKAEKEDMKSMKSEQPTAKGMCAIDCVAKKMKVVNADGSFNQAEADKLIAKLPEKKQEAVKKAIDECKTEAKAGLKECESGAKLGKCMMGKMKHHRKGKGKGNGGKKPKHSSEEEE